MIYQLHNWSIISDPNDGFKAPEQLSQYLIGQRDSDNRKVRTSKIISVNGKVVKTRSGSTYILGDIDPLYLKWLYDNGFNIDLANPIKK